MLPLVVIRNKKQVIKSGTINFKPNKFEGGGMVFLRFRQWLVDLKNSEDGFDEVFFESVRSHKGTDAAHKYGGFLAHVMAFCEIHQIPYKGVPVCTIKKHITGKGNATKYAIIDAQKYRLQEYCSRKGLDILSVFEFAESSTIGKRIKFMEAIDFAK